MILSGPASNCHATPATGIADDAISSKLGEEPLQLVEDFFHDAVQGVEKVLAHAPGWTFPVLALTSTAARTASPYGWALGVAGVAVVLTAGYLALPDERCDPEEKESAESPDPQRLLPADQPSSPDGGIFQPQEDNESDESSQSAPEQTAVQASETAPPADPPEGPGQGESCNPASGETATPDANASEPESTQAVEGAQALSKVSGNAPSALAAAKPSAEQILYIAHQIGLDLKPILQAVHRLTTDEVTDPFSDLAVEQVKQAVQKLPENVTSLPPAVQELVRRVGNDFLWFMEGIRQLGMEDLARINPRTLALSTPASINDGLRKILLHLRLDERSAVLLRVGEPVSFDALALHCHGNSARQAELEGGHAVHGWALSEDAGQGVSIAQFHSVWQAPDGSLHDVTPNEPGDDDEEVLFVPDRSREIILTRSNGKQLFISDGNVVQVGRGQPIGPVKKAHERPDGP